MIRIARCLVTLFVICAIFVAPASAEPTQIMTAAEAAAVIPADQMPEAEMFGWHNGGSFALGLIAEVEGLHVTEPITFWISVDGGEPMRAFEPVTFALRGGGTGAWWFTQAPMDSYFNDGIGGLRMPGTYILYADVPVSADVAVRFETTFEVEQYGVDLYACLEEWNLVSIWTWTYSLWESLPSTLSVTDNVGHRKDLLIQQVSPGFGISEGLMEFSGEGDLTLRISGPPEDYELVFQTDQLSWCNGDGGNTGKGSRTN